MKKTFGLYLVMTEPVVGYERCAEAAVERKVRYLQLRMKNRPRPEVVEMARRVREITAGTRTMFIVNDDVDIAREVDADGVHLGQHDMPVEQARARWTEPGKIFGLSTHNEEQAIDARAQDPDYIGVGPVHATPTKEIPDPTLGLLRMEKMMRLAPMTTVAIGGINHDNLAEVLHRGAVNFAVVRAVCRREDPAQAIRELQQIWNEHCLEADR
jgi:thiamine-phosphate pyrophosphorylase